ncbi:hypothetical protein F5Y03DRAFT_402819 [Xylaria venustula]|nr:hypothetical protein F5Y03DRAFT_402819 [Xylaria venustula]
MFSDVARQTIILSSVFTLLAVLSLSLHVKVRLRQGFGPEDWLTVAAFGITLALVAQTIWAVADGGQGQHVASVTHSEFEMLGKSLLVHEELWALVNTFIRLSTSIFIKKVFGVVNRWKLSGIAAMTLSVLHGLATLLIGALVCRPLSAAWDPAVKGVCINQKVSFVVIEAVGLAIDLMILFIPFLIIPQIQMSRKRKLGIILILSAGGFVTIITGLRIAALHRVNSSDLTYDQAYLGLLSILGALISIIATCVPSFAAIYNQMRTGIFLRYRIYTQWNSLRVARESSATAFVRSITRPSPVTEEGKLEV